MQRFQDGFDLTARTCRQPKGRHKLLGRGQSNKQIAPDLIQRRAENLFHDFRTDRIRGFRYLFRVPSAGLDVLERVVDISQSLLIAVSLGLQLPQLLQVANAAFQFGKRFDAE